jgi:threonine dehydratase
LIDGLAGFITVGEAAIAEAVRMPLRTTHHVAEGASAAGLAGLLARRERLAGRTVAIVPSGANIDEPTLRRVLNREI